METDISENVVTLQGQDAKIIRRIGEFQVGYFLIEKGKWGSFASSCFGDSVLK
jgi:hypothetical protein